MEEQRKRAILFVATLLCARKMLDPDGVRQATMGLAGKHGISKAERGLAPGRIRALLSISSCRFHCLSRLKHSRTFLSRTRVTTERGRSRISLQSGQTSKPSHQCCQIGTVLFIDRCELQSQSAAGLHVPHDTL